ncbi:antifungal protein ginkbilobin-like protein [Gossypium hirsutum]|uniref:Antifungal protein ginkbilobin-2-like n=1 Tax=Gossypium hirsutum TaxID=3635 RepID=A0A1U8JVQ2_GOSHI|nr:antifungal protein ginkbilobin-like protein [Gossypium hirsutum]XP_040960162.1 antifungal protein ginkbilobin-like protein [Gossypium hirsutum]
MGYLPKRAAAMIGLLLLCSNVISVPDTSIISVLCNSGSYSEGDPFATSLAFVLQDLETLTPERKGYDYFNISPYPNAFAYGHAACNQNLTTSDCATCLGAAKTVMLATCQSRIGSRSVLHDCTIRQQNFHKGFSLTFPLRIFDGYIAEFNMLISQNSKEKRHGSV